MRMWMVDPYIMCDQHLLGEHFELHKFFHSWVRKTSIVGREGAIEPLSYSKRHEELVAEMQKRGFNHTTPIVQPDFSYLSLKELNFRVDKRVSTRLLINRCKECNFRWGGRVCGIS